jgi:hypothetical protein
MARNEDTELHKTFMHNHMAAALVAILSTQQIQKLTDKQLWKTASNFLKKITEGPENTGIIIYVIEGRPVFQHRTLHTAAFNQLHENHQVFHCCSTLRGVMPPSSVLFTAAP